MKILITDADYKHTLAAVRSLGKKSIYIIAGSFSRCAQSFYSKYCKERLLYPNPRDEDEFIQFMLKYVRDNKIDVLFPVGYSTTVAFSKYKSEFCQYTKLPVADYDSVDIASNKDKTLKFAENLGFKIPKVYKTPEEIENFPVVAKGIKGSGQIFYVNSLEDLPKIKMSDFILQEYIPGEGYGFYALFNKGNVRAIFMHKRIREYPVTGGPSTAAESIYHTDLREQGLKLLNALNWHGLAMVEFKKDSRDGEFKLMEINPKVWGSLDISIASGVNFPYLLIKMAMEGDIEPIFNYKIGVKFRWPFPEDVLHLLANPNSAKAFFCDFFDRNTKSNIWLDDIKPNLFQIFITSRIVITHVRDKNLRYPHGIPMKKI